MRECLRLAERARGYVSPNPLVGAVLVRNNKIVARGWHKRFGGPHAEVECLRNYTGRVERSTLYVNLEPCIHFGKTPPCVDMILEREIPRVVVAMKDPNPLVAGKGIARLRRNGVAVEVGALENDARYLNRFFRKHIVEKIPYVHLKIAQTADGFIATDRSEMKYISSLAARKLVHHWRTEYDAVLVGAGTIQADNPRLDTRLAKGREPDIVILDGRFRLSGNERIFLSAKRRRVFVCSTFQATRAQSAKTRTLMHRNVQFILANAPNGRMNLRSMLRELYRQRIGSILVEGGGNVFSQFIVGNLVDELSIFVAPIRFSSGIPAMTPQAKQRVEGMIERAETIRQKISRDLLIHSHITPSS